MFKHMFHKLLGSVLHSKHKQGGYYRHSSSHRHTPMQRRYSSDDRGGYGYHNQQGHQYYKNRRGSSS
ncbi:hypothetical protein ABE504_21655 [Paenibacillus oryzisoli]|uniref:hypothetical protein n=1 Tax=Paenibacillus oryzisoli TaxID=1850517 RepID=UPI003D2719AD